MSWIQSKTFDLTFILLPPFLVLLILFLFPELTHENAEMGTFSWIFVVLGIDVAHVYGSLWRTYWHQENFHQHRSKFIMIPIGVWVGGVVLYSTSANIFWTTVAYVAVFHFMRQQYGFMRLYSRQEKQSKFANRLDFLLIHFLCLYPIIFWHVHLPRNFHWMIEGDFLVGLPSIVEEISFFLYLSLIFTYLVKEMRSESFNLPKNLLLLSTGLSWYFGMVYFNGDIAFTMTNVLAHGIPYMALVWAHERKESSRLQNWWGPFAFLGVLLLLAYSEEALWAGFVWREHLSAFEFMRGMPQINEQYLLAILVPLLTLPQATHYVLDGFIWKRKQQ
jgi:membrane protease YdiL (CAAX protease family)